MSTFLSLLSEQAEALRRNYQAQLSPDIERAIRDLCRCQTGSMGHAHWRCDHCQHQVEAPLSCGHRSCPQCQHHCTQRWLMNQQHKQLPGAHFMVTLTLPAQLRSLARAQPRALYQQMFAAGAALMKDFAKRKHNGKTGFTLVLHTHNRKRDLHPHLHVIVPAGYYDASRHQWHKGAQNYLYNAKALAKVWRAKMLEAINQHPLLQLPAVPLPKQWVVDCRAVGRGDSALKYLSRYLYRGVLPDKDILSWDDEQVTFRYKDSSTQQWQTRTLPVLKFLWLILQHALPKGFQRVRDYGLLHGSAKALRLQLMLLLLRIGWTPLPLPTLAEKATRPCPCCNHEMMCTGVVRTR